LSHIAEDGSSFALLSYDAPGAAASRALAELFGEPHFRDEFIVVESVSPPRADEAFQPLYHLSLATDVADVR
jgi:hypothetical protein